MRIALAAFTLLIAAPVAAKPLALAKPCKPEATMAARHASARVRPLGEMPPARQVLAVYRETNGCTAPVVVRERVGMQR